MNKEEQLKRAKSLSITFLHIPIATTEYSPIVVKHPYFESAFLYDYDSKAMFNALENTEKYNEFLYTYAKKIIEPCKSIKELLNLICKPYRVTYLSFLMKEKNYYEKGVRQSFGGTLDAY